MDYILQESTKSVALDAAGNPVISPAALKRTLERIGDKKLDVILGKSSADTLRQIAAVTQDTMTLPPQRAGSTTVPNFLAVMNRVPGIGPITRGAAEGVTKLREVGLRKKQVYEALNYHGNTPSAPAAARLSIRDIGRNPALPFAITPSLGLRLAQEE